MNTIMSEANLDAAAQERLSKTLPVRRTGVPEDIANAVAFLASENSSYITVS
jgi:NAD(P)-dependent dehydrogenase (short-subunit alcohol dehydrogenase family)